MAKKKQAKPQQNKKKELEKQVENLEEMINKITQTQELIKNIEQKKQFIKEDLKNQLVAQNKFGKQFDDMIEDYLKFVELKENLQHDIDVNGIRYKAVGGNGFTTFKPNESVERLIKVNAQMLKILQDLDLKAPEESGSDEGDDLL